MKTALKQIGLAQVLVLLLVTSGCQESAAPEGAVVESQEGGVGVSDRAIPEGSANGAATSSQTNMGTGTASSPPAGATATDTPSEIVVEPLPPRTSVAGRWEFQLSTQGADIPGLLLDIQPTAPPESRVVVVGDSESMPGWTLKGSELTETTASIQLANQDGAPVDFQGTLRDGEIRGNVVFGLEGSELARLVPSQRNDLKGVRPRPSDGAAAISSLQGNADLSGLIEVVRGIPGTALSYDVYRVIFSRLRQTDQAGVDPVPLIAEYLAAAEPWGERVVARTNLDIGYSLALQGRNVDVTLKHLDLAEQQLGEAATPAQQSRLTLSRGMAYLHTDQPDDQALGVKILAEIRAEEPFNLTVTEALGKHAEQAGRQEEALQLFAELAVLPSGPGDQQRVSDLWEQLGRDPAELAGFLDGVYEQTAYRFADKAEADTQPRERQRVVLGELFTGATCPPCVAADLATGGLEQSFPQSQLIMVRYHQHVPGPDPLVCEVGMQRADFYEIQGTPTLFLNGQDVSVEGMYGPMFMAPVGYLELRDLLAPMLEESSDLQIQLSAEVADQTLKLRAAVEGLAADAPDSLRLRLCLVEHKVSFAAANGVRIHENLVRAMPGGPEGQASLDGKLTFEAEIDLEQVRSDILAHLATVEEQLQQEFPEKPLSLQDLRLVGFVQNDSSREVLQAAVVPVRAD